MNIYQTTSNHHYYNCNQHNLLISPPPSASSIYSGQSINDDQFYTNIDNTNSSLIHMFINNNEQRFEDSKMNDHFYQNSSSFTNLSSPSPSSSYNSSNGQMMNWTPNNSQTGQEDSVVLYQLDELTKSLNNQMVEMNEKKCKVQNTEVSYNTGVQVQGDQLARTNYEFNSNSIINHKTCETNLYVNLNCLPPVHLQTSESLLIQNHSQQFPNANLAQQQSLQPSIDNRNHISNLHPMSTNSSLSHLSSAINSASVNSSLPSKSPIQQSPYKPVLSSIQSNSLSIQQTKLTHSMASNNSLQSNQLNNQFPINQLNSIKVKHETITDGNGNLANSNQFNVIIGYDSEGRPIRNTANKKERRRTLSINTAFGNLRDCIPNVPADTKLSKIKTLRLATSYISYLMELLDDSAPLNSKRRLMMTLNCEDFKVDLQRFKGRSKNSIHLIYPSKFNDKLNNRKSENLSNQKYSTQQNVKNFQQTSSNLNANCGQDIDHKGGESKSTIYNPTNCYQVPTANINEQYEHTSERIKGRTGWPQHVIKNVWASELQENAQIS